MTHKDILKACISELGIMETDILKWYPNGHNSIRVLLKNSAFNGEFAFSYEGKGCWIFETADHFAKRKLKEVRK